MYLSKQKIALMKTYFEKQPAIQRVHLFGSFARGEATRASDIDLLVLLNHDFMPLGIEYFQMCYDLEFLLKRKVDFVSESALSQYVRPHVEPEKILIYEKN